jgi:hypothetical protein
VTHKAGMEAAVLTARQIAHLLSLGDGKLTAGGYAGLLLVDEARWRTLPMLKKLMIQQPLRCSWLVLRPNP